MAQGSNLNKENFDLSVFSADKGGALDILSIWVAGIVWVDIGFSIIPLDNVIF